MYTHILRSNPRVTKFANLLFGSHTDFKFADLQMITVSQLRAPLHCQPESE
jgi:hypothetical protein